MCVCVKRVKCQQHQTRESRVFRLQLHHPNVDEINGILHLSLSCGSAILQRLVGDKIDCGSELLLSRFN